MFLGKAKEEELVTIRLLQSRVTLGEDGVSRVQHAGEFVRVPRSEAAKVVEKGWATYVEGVMPVSGTEAAALAGGK